MKVKQHIPDWNKDAVWNNIEGQLQQKKKRRLLYWWFVGMASTLVLVGCLVWFNQVRDKSWNKNSNSKSEQKNSHQEKPVALDAIFKQDAEANHTAIKLNTNKKQQSSKSNIKSKVVEVQKEKTIIASNKLKSKRRTAIIAAPNNVPFEEIETQSALNEKNEFVASLPMLSSELSALHFNRMDTLQGGNVDFSLSENNEKNNPSTFLWTENGVSFGKKSFINLNNQTIDRNTTEQFRFIQTHAIGIQKFINNNWSLNLGVAYQTIYEKYEHVSSFTEEMLIFSEEATIYDLGNGISYAEPGLSTQIMTTSRHIIHNNFIHRLSVPVELAYIFKNDKWSLEPSLGFRFQYFQRFKGVILQNEHHFFDLTAINDTYYSNSTSLGLIASLNWKYKISQKHHLGLKFNYERDDFLNLIKNDFFSRYETIGLQLGYYRSF